jgi:hypothetical protein
LVIELVLVIILGLHSKAQNRKAALSGGLRCEDGLHIEQEEFAVDRPLDYPRGVDAVVA